MKAYVLFELKQPIVDARNALMMSPSNTHKRAASYTVCKVSLSTTPSSSQYTDWKVLGVIIYRRMHHMLIVQMSMMIERTW